MPQDALDKLLDKYGPQGQPSQGQPSPTPRPTPPQDLAPLRRVSPSPTPGGDALDALLNKYGGDGTTPAPQGVMGNVLSTISPVLDFLSRGQYASAGFFDAMINDEASIGDALSLAGQELISPTRRKSFEDLLKRAKPDFAANNPTATKVLGFLGDLALDPTTYLGVGLGTKGARLGGRALTTLGEELQLAAREALKGKNFAVGLTKIPGRRLVPGGPLSVEFPHHGQRDKAIILAKESLTRLPGELAEKVNVKTSAHAQYAIEPIGSEMQKYTGVIKKAFGGKLPDDLTPGDLFDLSRKISLERLGVEGVTEAVMFLRRPLSEVEIIDSADRMISRLVSQFPKLDKEIFKPKSLKLQIGVPFTPLQRDLPLINTNMLRAVGLDKLDRLWKTVAKLPAIKQAVNAGKVIRGAFDRFYEVDPRYVDEVIKPFENERSFVAAQVIKDAEELIKTFDLDKEARERVSRVMNAFDAGMASLPLTELQQNFAPEVFQAALRQAPLKPREQALIMSLMEGYMRAADLEQAASIVGQAAANHDPRVFRAIFKGEEAVDWIKRNRPDGSVDVRGFKDLPMLRTATDITHAIREGANLDQDAILLYASRLMRARMALPKRQAEGALRAIYGTANLEELKKIAPKVASDWRYFGKLDLPHFRTEEANEILNLLDNVQRLWKGSKTILNPGFSIKQIFQNSFQSALALGNNGWRAFDPTNFTLAAAKTLGLRGTSKTELPDAADRWLKVFTEGPGEYEAAKELALKNINENIRFQDFAQDAVITTPTGKKYMAEELDQLEQQLGIVRGVTGVTGERLNRSLLKELGPGRATSFTDKAVDGMRKAIGSYFGMAAKVEDTTRRALFYNGLRMGDTPQRAAQRVNEALFDYQRGLSEFEEQVMRRLIPFYCVPDYSQALTRDGWKSCDELKVGEDVLTYNKDGDRLEWKPCLDVAVFEYDQDICVLKNSYHEILCTDNHRWVTQRVITTRNGPPSYRLEAPTITETKDLHGGLRIVCSALLADDGDSILTPDQARLLGWLITDGYWRTRDHSPNHVEALIYQHPSKFLDEVIAVAGGNPRLPHPDSGVVAVPVLQERIKPLKPYLDKGNLPKVVTRLSREAAEAMFDAMYKGDGTVGTRTSDFLACEHPGVREAAQILCFLLGKRTAENYCNGIARGVTVQKARHIGVQGLKISTTHYTGRVWCPRTENGTWVMKQGRLITITGNSYTKFAVPFALKQAIQNPGSVTATNKVLELVSDIYSSDDQGGPRTLSREQLEMFMPKFLLDQPRIFWGWNPEGNPEFSTFQGMTPFDILSTFTLQDKFGEIDWRATAEKSIGGLITPILKIPAELAANKEFFTQRVIDEAGGGRGRLYDVKDTNLDMVLPESVKQAIGWEWAMDRRTGKYIAYVNPYMAYLMAQLSPPVARQFINLPDLSGGSIMELAMKQALGIGDPDIDIRQSLIIQNAQDRKYLEDLKSRVRTLRRQGRADEAEEARQEYIKILTAVTQKRQSLGSALTTLGPSEEEEER